MARWWHHASAVAVYRDPGEDPISFGDIFEGEHLIDVYAKLETRPLGGGDTPRITTERILKKFNRPLPGPPTPSRCTRRSSHRSERVFTRWRSAARG